MTRPWNKIIAERDNALAEIERLRADSTAKQQRITDLGCLYIDTKLRAEKAEAERDALAKDARRYRAALESIAANSCCDRCQEAALVARAAIDAAAAQEAGEE